MKKKIIAAVSLALVTLFVLGALQRLLMPKYIDNPEGLLVGEYYAEAGGHDVLFLGDCEVYESFVPAILWEKHGISSYVRGSSQQLVWQSYYLLEEMLRYETPSVVVFNVYALKYGVPQNNAYNRMTLDGMRWSSSKIGAVSASMTEDESFVEYVFPLLRFHSRICELEARDVEYYFSAPKVSDSGYLMQTRIDPMTSEREGEALFDYTLPESAFAYLEKMRQLCEKNEIELLLIKAPTNHWKFWWYDEYDAQIEEYAEKNGLDYINLIPHCERIGIDWSTDTYDKGMHLNVFGAEKLSDYFGNILCEEYGVVDRRSDKELSDKWNARVAAYYERKDR